MNIINNPTSHIKAKLETNHNRKRKALPHSLEAEQTILGCLMVDNNIWTEIATVISEQDFMERSHRIIYNEMKLLLETHKPIDLITLSDSLEQKDKLTMIGGSSYLADLYKPIANTANILEYAAIVKDRAIKRELIKTAQELINNSYSPKGKSSSELLAIAESKIFHIAEHRVNESNGPKPIDNILGKTVANIEKAFKSSKKGITGLSSGYYELDIKTCGLQKSDLIIIAARPSMGKTTLALNICENAVVNENKPVLIFSLEMPSDQIMIRILASLSKINQTNIRTGQLNSNDWSRLSNTMNMLLKKKNLYIDDSPELTHTDLRTRAKRIYREYNGLSLIMVDYMQLMKVPSLSENRALEIAEVSRSLKALAKELQVPILALSQLNRNLEQRVDKRPINSDLRESGSIEQDADLILFIYRDEVYRGCVNSGMNGIAEVIIGKQRNGPTGTIKLRFNGQLSRFDSYS
ncbi:replicative DNA helicase [Candidatus Tremblaya phenacola]|uniref:replicative DNA helicase n=1 Tax=Candidatus Tremblayella phenacoccinincola TaxID=1010676 RepID=UPI00132F87D0|nr:replicative DNA helicase [Candidatus Tremblaya phenacola]KAH0998303.1 Replicative DNA helicase [Candidatus Tremblaya phenacola]